MKKIFYFLNIIGVLIFTSCEKDAPESVNFDVSTESREVKVGDSITFKFNGNADIISFYSGELGKEYQYRDRIEAEGLKLQLTLGTRVLFGTQTKNLKLYCSTKFDGLYSPAGIKEEDWVDLTDKFTWSPTPAGVSTTTTTTSGPIDLSEFVETGKPIYFAFKYEGWASTTAALGGRTWRIYTFNLETVAPDGSKSAIATVRNAGWIGIDIVNPANKWTIASTEPYLYFAPASTLLPSLDWVVSAPFQPTSLKPDKGTPIKAFLDKMQNFKHAFKAPGVYKVTFVAKNVNGHGEKTVVKELDITVK